MHLHSHMGRLPTMASKAPPNFMQRIPTVSFWYKIGDFNVVHNTPTQPLPPNNFRPSDLQDYVTVWVSLAWIFCAVSESIHAALMQTSMECLTTHWWSHGLYKHTCNLSVRVTCSLFLVSQSPSSSGNVTWRQLKPAYNNGFTFRKLHFVPRPFKHGSKTTEIRH